MRTAARTPHPELDLHLKPPPQLYRYEETVGEGRCPVVDTWWQTETGGHMIAPLPGAWNEKPGCATLPFFGSSPVLLDPDSGKELTGEARAAVPC